MNFRNVKGISVFTLGVVLLLGASPARGDATVSWDFDNGFDPSSVIIGPGEKVTFGNYDSYGFGVNITLDMGPVFYLQPSHSMQVQFPTQPGSYNFHSDWGENGAVIVAVPPTVAIISPPNGAVFSPPASFDFTVSASENPGDYVANVQLFLGDDTGTNLIADLAFEPYSASITNLGPGMYALIAIATDAYGLTTTQAVTFTVTGGTAIQMNSARVVSGKFLCDITGLTPGKTNIVQVSSNLTAWTAIKTNLAASPAMTITNVSTMPRQFFRVLEMP